LIILASSAASFAPISLPALEKRAGLATRSESKYLLDVTIFERLMRELVPHYLILEIDGAHILTPMHYLITTGAVTANNVQVPINICGVAIGVLGTAQAACDGGASASL
jgi:hypothetical protein